MRSRLALALLLGLLAAEPRAQPGADYLPGELRARVEKLKADLATTPSNATNREERARVLWDWANAHALRGGTLPVELTRTVAGVFAYPDFNGGSEDQLDRYVREMILLDQEPEALGELTADSGPFEAGAYVSINQTFTVGSRPIQPGGGFLVARHFMANYGMWQTRDAKADNYVSIRSTNPRVSFASGTLPVAGMHGGLLDSQDQLVFRLASGALHSGDEVTITYGDRSQGSRGFRMADFASDRMPLPLYVAFSANGDFFTLPIQPIQVTGTTLAGVLAFAPSIVAANEPFDLVVRARDRYYNRARDGHPDWRVKLNGQIYTELPAGPDAISVLRDLRLQEPGVYRFTIENRDGTVLGDANPVLVEAAPTRRIYWGDTHAHSGFAEGIGGPEALLRWARDDARLDYATHSEHDIWLDDAEWDVLRRSARSFTRQNEFIAFLGYEWTVRNLQGGHHTVLFRTPENRSRVDARTHPTLSRLYQGLRASTDSADVLVIPHAHQAGDYRQSDPELEPLVEITSQRGNFEWSGRRYLQQGHQVGFTAASDNHLSQPGYSAPRGDSLAQRGGLGALLAPAKTSDALFDAMKNRQSYATTGDRIIMDMAVNGTAMGQRAPMAAQRVISGRVIGTAPIATVTVMKNDAVLSQQDYLTNRTEAPASRASFIVSFHSDSQPLHAGDNPRGWRHWRGTLTIDNADLVGAEGTDFHNDDVQSLTVDPAKPRLIRFSTLTRGDTSSIRLDLDGVKRTTQVLVNLEASSETGGAPPLYRPPQELPAARVALPIRELQAGRLEQRLKNGGYVDRVSLRHSVAQGPLDVRFEVKDMGQLQGDYYYVRVDQTNDAMAWSSPVWVGGYASR